MGSAVSPQEDLLAATGVVSGVTTTRSKVIRKMAAVAEQVGADAAVTSVLSEDKMFHSPPDRLQ